MVYKLQHKQNGNTIGVFDQINQQEINQLIENNGHKAKDYEVIEFTPVAIMQPIPEPPIKTDIEILIDILKEKGIIKNEDIQKYFKKS